MASLLFQAVRLHRKGGISEKLRALVYSGAARQSWEAFFGGQETYPAMYGCRTEKEAVGNGCGMGRLEELDG